MPVLLNWLMLITAALGLIVGVASLILGVRQARRFMREGDNSVTTKVLSGDYVYRVKERNKEAA